jgi:1,4-dihydroxy-2-naphthoate octaprenyltransferase
MAAIQPWVQALRLRTLPLAAAGILLGNALAYSHGQFDPIVFWLTLLTALCYQLLSNLANDLGDGERGTDAQRAGEARMVASGLITPASMRRAVYGLALLSAAATLLTAVVGTHGLHWGWTLGFSVVGLGAIWAAIRYTLGSKPYGYSGYGDFFVLVFFGLVSIPGTYFLQVHQWSGAVMLPALTVGLWSAGVLNLNNLRDAATDALHGKRTLVVQWGPERAKWYHLALLVVGFDLGWLYHRFWGNHGNWSWLFWLPLPLLVIHARKVLKAQNPSDYEPLLPQLALLTLAWSVLMGLSELL